MTEDAETRLRDALSFAANARAAAKNLYSNERAEALVSLHATLFCICITAEALNHVPKEVQNLAPAIQWQKIRGMRNHLLHSYWQIDFDIVADVVAHRLQPLMASLDRLIELVQSNAQ